MGGLGPGIGGFEILVIGIVALLVVGPKDLPLLMRRVGQFVGKARAMANEFRASFDDLARESELEELRKEVKALKTGSGVYALGDEASNAFKDIRQQLETPLDSAPVSEPVTAVSGEPEKVATVAEPEVVATGIDEWPDLDAQAAQVEQLPTEDGGKIPQ